MANTVLVAYSSKYGATREIAEKIGEVLKGEGLTPSIMPVKGLKNLADYKDIVVGSAMYMGMWRSEAASFLKKNESLLAERRVWLFGTGPSGKGDPAELLKGVVEPLNVKQVIERIKPKDSVVFHGNLNEQKLNPLEKWVIKRVGSSTGDFRDWDMITKWAKKVAKEIKK